MPIDTLLVYCGVYGDAADALADYELVKELHTEANLSTPTTRPSSSATTRARSRSSRSTRPRRASGVCLAAGSGLATGLVVALFPAAAIGGGLLLGTTGAGALLGSLAGHAAAGMSRGDLKDLGESLDEGEAGLVVVAVSDMQAKVRSAMKRAQKIEEKQLKADQKEIEADAAEAQKS